MKSVKGIIWLRKPVPLWPGPGSLCRVKVHGIGFDTPRDLRDHWLALGRSAAKEAANAPRS